MKILYELTFELRGRAVEKKDFNKSFEKRSWNMFAKAAV
jgi:hypothetical protein